MRTENLFGKTLMYIVYWKNNWKQQIEMWRMKCMANSYQIIDEKTWKRAMHCMVFRNSIEPAFCVTFEADITNFRRMVKEQGLSFTLAMVHAVCK